MSDATDWAKRQVQVARIVLGGATGDAGIDARDDNAAKIMRVVEVQQAAIEALLEAVTELETDDE